MVQTPDLLARLTDKNAAAACACAEKLARESEASDQWYPYFDDIATLLRHKNSLVRNRALAILAANARWDTENKFARLLAEFLTHITDEKPITARQCVKALPKIAQARPELLTPIRSALENADLSSYPGSMQPLILKDITAALQQMGDTK